jgi:flagellar motor protein MotB
MNRLSVLSTAALLAAGLASAGCCDKEKKELLAFQQRCDELQMKNQQLQTDFAASEAKNADLLIQLEGKDASLSATRSELAVANSKLAGLEAGSGNGGTLPKAPPGWQDTATGAKLTLTSDVLFGSGRAALSDSGLAQISKAAGAIKATYPTALVRVYGFTDSDPINKSAKLWTDNLDLSANRAMAVTRQLVKLGISAESIESIGMGATHFLASNSTSQGKAKNRRVEIVVVTK